MSAFSRPSIPVLTSIRYPSPAESQVQKNVKSFILSGVKYDRQVKGSSESAICAVIRMTLELGLDEVKAYLGGIDWVVPVPGHSRYREGDLWPSLSIAGWLHHFGVGQEVRPCVKRTVKVDKSATAAPGKRPTVKTHLESIAVDHNLVPPTSVLLADDVVTRGATMAACAIAIQRTWPNASVKAFAIARTDGAYFDRDDQVLIPEIERIEYDLTNLRYICRY